MASRLRFKSDQNDNNLGPVSWRNLSPSRDFMRQVGGSAGILAFIFVARS
jgi:hypothetical protein